MTVRRGASVKVSFLGLPRLKQVSKPHLAPRNGLRIASLLDLAGTKAAVVQRRAEAKDYIDLAALIETGRIDLGLALASAKAIYGAQFNPQITLKALAFFEEGNLKRLPAATKQVLVNAVRTVKLDRLPVLTAQSMSRTRGR